MGRHSPAVAELDRFEATLARRRALELVAESDTLDLRDPRAVAAWVGSASAILKELARG